MLKLLQYVPTSRCQMLLFFLNSYPRERERDMSSLSRINRDISWWLVLILAQHSLIYIWKPLLSVSDKHYEKILKTGRSTAVFKWRSNGRTVNQFLDFKRDLLGNKQGTADDPSWKRNYGWSRRCRVDINQRFHNFHNDFRFWTGRIR